MKNPFILIQILLFSVLTFASDIYGLELDGTKSAAIISTSETEAATYMIPRYVIGSGGISGAANDNYVHAATAGQTFAGVSQGANHWLYSGLWLPAAYEAEETISGDFNGDGTVWLDDFSIFGSAFGSSGESANWNPLCDMNGDGVVWLEDFSIFAENFGKTVGNAKPVPPSIAADSEANPDVHFVAGSDESEVLRLRVSLSDLKDIRAYTLKINYDPGKFEILKAERISAVGSAESDDMSVPLLIRRDELNFLTIADLLSPTTDTVNRTTEFTLRVERKDDQDTDFMATDIWLLDVDGNLSKLADARATALPGRFEFSQNYPNPFNMGTLIPYSLARDASVKLIIYNTLGQEVRTLVDGDQPAGSRIVTWDGKDNQGRYMSTGLYLCRFEAEGSVQVKKMLLVK